MRVAEIDVQDDQLVRQWWELAREGDAYGREEFATYWSLQELTGSFRSSTAIRSRPLGCWDGDTLIGSCDIVLPLLDNTHVAYLEPIVHPDHRRRGAGTAMLEAATNIGTAAGRSTFIIEVNRPLPDGREPSAVAGSAFLERHGYTAASTELHRVLRLPASDQHLASLETAIGTLADGYELVGFGDRVPDDLVAGYCALQTAFNAEVPLGELDLEVEHWDEDRVRKSEQRAAIQGRHQRRVVAIAPDGSVVALTEMLVAMGQPTDGYQGGTLVLPEHRGHRLGMATKLANLRGYMADFPDVTRVHSWNAEENGPMVAINDALGFRPVEYLAEMQWKA